MILERREQGPDACSASDQGVRSLRGPVGPASSRTSPVGKVEKVGLRTSPPGTGTAFTFFLPPLMFEYTGDASRKRLAQETLE